MLLCCGRGTAFAHAPLRLAAGYGHAALPWTKDGLCPRSFHRLSFDPRPRQRKRNPQPFSVPSAALPADFIAGDSSRASPPPFFSKVRLRTPCSCSFSPPPAPQARAAAPAPPPPRCTQLELAAIPGVPRRKGVLGKPSGACLLCRDTCSPLAKCCPYLALCSLPPPPVSATAILTWVAVGVVRPRVSPGVAKAGLLPSQLGSRTGPCSQRAGLCLLACRRAAWSLGIRIHIRELRIDPTPVYSANDLWSAPSTILVDIVWSSSAFLETHRCQARLVLLHSWIHPWHLVLQIVTVKITRLRMIPSHQLLLLHLQGTAIFPLQGCLNYSCCPNAKARELAR